MSSPSSAPEGWHHLHPAMLWFEAGRILRRLLLPLIVGGVAVSRREGGMLAFIVVSGVISAAGFVSRYLSFRYRLTPEGIELREGIFTRRQRNIALARISHINTHQNAVARALGVVRVEIETEGGGAPEASFATSFQLGGALLSVLVVWRYARRLIGNEGEPATEVPTWLHAAMTFADGLVADVTASPALIVLTIVVLLFAIWGLGILATILRWQGFRITEQAGELQLQSGIFSRSRTVISRDRTQAIEIRSNPARERLRLAQISIVAAGAARPDRARSRMFVPLTKDFDVTHFVKVLWPDATGELEWSPVHPYYRRQLITRGALTLIAAVIAVAYAFVLNVATLVAIAIVSLVWAWSVWRIAERGYAHTAFALDDDYVHVRGGAINPRHWIVAIARIQAVILRESPFQRRNRVMNVVIDVNGLANRQRITIPNVPRDAAEALQLALTPQGGQTPRVRPLGSDPIF
jgi:putative membrane protein